MLFALLASTISLKLKNFIMPQSYSVSIFTKRINEKLMENTILGISRRARRVIEKRLDSGIEDLN